MDYGALETELKGVLLDYFAANSLSAIFDAREMPENQNELLQSYDKGMCNVQYLDSTYGDPESTSIIEQKEMVKVGVFMRTDTVKDAKGAYQLLKHVKLALIGYKPEDARTRMWVSNYSGWVIEEGQVGDVLEFTFETRNVQHMVDPVELSIDSIDTDGSTAESGNLVELDAKIYVDAELAGSDEEILTP